MSIYHQNTPEIKLTPHHFNSSKEHGGDFSVIEENNEEMVGGKYLGMDFGKAKVGLAMADGETRMAFAYGTLPNDKNLKEKLAEIVSKEGVGSMVVGIPSYVKIGSVETEARKLGEFLEKSLKVGVFYEDEMFTTKMAETNLKEKGAKGIKRFDDQEAARIILQEWLDNNKIGG
jgi:putative holliday junction resolvase